MLLNTLLNADAPRPMGATRITAVIFDWAGTIVDFGSLAPVRTLQRAFGDAGVPITEKEARLDMGIAKRDHIAALLASPRIREEWTRIRRRPANESDIDVIYERFIPLQMECLQQYSRVIREVPAITQHLRARGIKIGSTTGYTREMLDMLLKDAAKQGFEPDCGMTPGDVGAGRPAPFMIYQAVVKLQVYPLSAVLKVGDTTADIEEGLNAGVWSVGVAVTGNGIGLSENAFDALSKDDQRQFIETAAESLKQAGAHYVIETLADLPVVVADIESRLQGRVGA